MTAAAVEHTSVWLLLAAGIVGFAAAWLAFEVRRAWSPEPEGSGARPVPTRGCAEDLSRLGPDLVDQMAELRRSLAWLQDELGAVRRESLRTETTSQAPPSPAPTAHTTDVPPDPRRVFGAGDRPTRPAAPRPR
jgi:hypothetical protein